MTTPLSFSQAKTYARIAGVLYLLIIVCGMFSEGFVRGTLLVPGDAAATAQNILASEGLFRLGFGSDLIMVLCDVAVALVFFILLRPVHEGLSLLAAFFRLVQAAVIGMNLLNYFQALRFLNEASYLQAFGEEQRQALSLFSLEAHGYGYLISGAFFAVNCLIMGYLLYQSAYFPRALGVLIALAGLSYLLNSFVNFLLPRFTEATDMLVLVVAVVAELGLCLWLLLKGVRSAE